MKSLIVILTVLALSTVNCKKEECSDEKCLHCEVAECDNDLEICEIFTEGLKTFAKCLPMSEYKHREQSTIYGISTFVC